MTIKKYALIVGGIITVLSLIIAVLIWNGIILLNNPTQKEYPVRGVDVSSYQGEIDWNILSANDISFAFIKATEGSSFVDPQFSINYSEAKKTDLRIGAYHFFSYESDGLTQANNFINNVPKTDNMLPPVIDIEFYGDNEKNPPSPEAVTKQLQVMTETLQEYYGMPPIIYATEKSYLLYISNSFNECDIWIRNVMFSPKLPDNRQWTFWQYTNREQLKGYSGSEKFIDVNVFYGTADEFRNYAK